MPWFVRIGHIPSNVGKVGSRGYHLVRRGTKIAATWGPVEVLPGRRFHWCRKPQSKTHAYGTEAKAKAAMKERVRQRVEIERYGKLPTGARILAVRKSEG